MSRLELKIPPDVIWVVVAVLMWLVSAIARSVALPGLVRWILAAGFAAAGVVLIVRARMELARAGTTWLPARPERTTGLVTTGVFGITRNPIYVGMWLVLVGWAVFLTSPLALALSTLLPLYLTRFQVIPEERALESAMGDGYREYAHHVRRWL